MKKRYNNLERTGLHRIGLIIEEDFEWIFREQPIADVGIDALVEQCTDGIPTGKFLAFQIKAGKGNVYEKRTENVYVYYISNIHYYYWINLDIPIVLLIYIPKKKKSFWIEIVSSNIKRTNKGWKIPIPFKNEFNQKSKKEINEIALKGKGKMLQVQNNGTEDIYNIEHFTLVTQSLSLLTNFTDIYTNNINTSKSKLEELLKKEDADKKFQAQIQKHTLITVFESLASRLYNEIHIFAVTYVKAILAIKATLLLQILIGNFDIVKNDISKLNKLMDSFDHAIYGINAMKDSIKGISNDDVFKIRSSTDKAELALGQVIKELEIGKKLGLELLTEINKELTKDKK